MSEVSGAIRLRNLVQAQPGELLVQKNKFSIGSERDSFNSIIKRFLIHVDG